MLENTHLKALACALLLVFAPARPALAGTADGRYHASIDGVASTIELGGSDGDLRGVLQEGALRLNLQGSLSGNALRLQMSEPMLGLPLGSLEGTLSNGVFDAAVTVQDPFGNNPDQRKQARYVREGASAPAAADIAPAVTTNGSRDPALVGTWTHDEVINSPGGFGAASFSTRRTMVLSADGRAEQWAESAGGGGEWSYGGGRQTEFSGQWQTRDGALLLRAAGQSEFVPATRYRFSGQYLVLEGGGKKLILQRQ